MRTHALLRPALHERDIGGIFSFLSKKARSYRRNGNKTTRAHRAVCSENGNYFKEGKKEIARRPTYYILHISYYD